MFPTPDLRQISKSHRTGFPPGVFHIYPSFPKGNCSIFLHFPPSLDDSLPPKRRKTDLQAAVQNSSSLGPTVENSHVGNHQMHVKIRTGLLEGRTNVCPAIDDWDAKDDLFGEPRELRS
jgi:hypothetical protein